MEEPIRQRYPSTSDKRGKEDKTLGKGLEVGINVVDDYLTVSSFFNSTQTAPQSFCIHQPGFLAPELLKAPCQG